MTAHNHVTRDIKPIGKCPGCDAYHARHTTPPCEVHLYGMQSGYADVCTRCGHRRPWSDPDSGHTFDRRCPACGADHRLEDW